MKIRILKFENFWFIQYKIGGNALTQRARGRWPRALAFLCNLTGPRCLCQISAAAAGAVVLVAGPLLEPLVPPLLRVPPPVRDAGPLWEPPVPPLLHESVFLDLFRIYLPRRRVKEERQSKASKHECGFIWIYAGFMPDLYTKKTVTWGAARKIGSNKSDAPLGPRT